MAIGMTYDQYWYGDVHMARAFYRADRLRQKHMNEEAWLYGAYFARALDATVCNAFRKKSDPQSEYPKQPIWDSSWDEEEVRQEDSKKREEAEALYAQAYMENMMLAGQKWGKPK